MPTRLIDLLLVASGIALIVAGVPAGGTPLVVLGAIVPLLQLSARRGGDHAHLVPAELSAAHRAVVAVGTADARAEADRIVRDVAVLLAGRTPRGGAQRRFVNDRVTALEDLATAMRAARNELDAISPAIDPEHAPRVGGVLVGTMVVLLFPLFALWDLTSGLWFGIAIRLRAVMSVVGRSARGAISVLGDARRAWTTARIRLAAAAREARHRFVLARKV